MQRLGAHGGHRTVSFLAFDSNASGHWEIYLVSASGGKPKRLTSGAINNDDPNWARDGKWIYFASDRTGQDQVWKMPVTGGDAIQVTRNGGTSGSESHDGKLLYYAKGRSGTSLWKVPVSGGNEIQVLESLLSLETFVVVDTGIYFIPASPFPISSSSIRFFSFATRKLGPITTIENPSSLGFTVHPDGRSILFSQLDYRGSELMLVENFR
jgi:Tol biopolymer transport system component